MQPWWLSSDGRHPRKHRLQRFRCAAQRCPGRPHPLVTRLSPHHATSTCHLTLLPSCLCFFDSPVQPRPPPSPPPDPPPMIRVKAIGMSGSDLSLNSPPRPPRPESLTASAAERTDPTPTPSPPRLSPPRPSPPCVPPPPPLPSPLQPPPLPSPLRPPPPTPTPPAPLVDRVNMRFRDGKPSNDFAEVIR